MKTKTMTEMPDSQQPQTSQQAFAAHGFAQAFGILPSTALLALGADGMLFTADVVSMGILLPLCCAAGAALGVITFLSQKRYYGDDTEAALIKALILAFLTCIPSPIPWLLWVPSGIIGFVHNRRKN